MSKNKTFIIAELSANKNYNYQIAAKTIEAIASTGADAIRVQINRPESLTLDLNTGVFKPIETGSWKGYTMWKLYEENSMPVEWIPKLKEMAEGFGLTFFGSPMDKDCVDFFESIGNPIYKIASYEITDIPLIEYTASKGKPMLISTGAATIEDIQLAIDSCKKVGNEEITLLKCTSEYPSLIEDANLATIADMKERFNVEVGISDHTTGELVPALAVSMGATVIEKHFILDKNLECKDSAFSMEPYEFKEMVKAVRNAEAAFGQKYYSVIPKIEKKRRSLFAIKDIQEGEELTEENIKSLRLGYGMHPKYLNKILGTKAKCAIPAGTPLQENLFS